MSPSIAASSIVFLLAVSLTHFQTSCGATNDDNNTAFYLQKSKCFPPTSTAPLLGFDLSYQDNVRQFLDELPTRAMNNSGFFKDMVMVGSSLPVFGMAMCQADIPWPAQCKRCLQAASNEIRVVCALSINVSAVYPGCVLRYSNAPILPVAAEDDDDISKGYPFYTQNHAARVHDTAAFAQTRRELFTALATAAGVSPLMIVSGNRTFNSTHKLYGLAQCNRDLARKLCSSLINSTIESIPKFAAEVQWSEGVSITGFSLYIRYDMTPFAVYVPPTAGIIGPWQPATPPTGPSQPETAKGRLVHGVEVIVIPVSISVIIFLATFIVMRLDQKKQIGDFQNVTGLWDFPFGHIKSATNNFHKDKLLGEGGFGKVYKGTFNIENNKELAVKCVTNPSAAKHLKDELRILAQLQHKNVVRLVGFCNNDRWFRRGRGLYICNEYISNDSLDKHMVDVSSGQPVLEWQTRREIIHGICTGLKYLHQECNSNILHMDLKPSNILLDDKMTPKIADFGLSRAFLQTKTHTYTKEVKGSNGYIAPEFLEDGNVSRPCDIYSLGVLILAIVMGQEPTAMHDPGGVMFINKVRDKFSTGSEANPNTCSAKDREQLKKDASLKVDDCIEDVEKCIGLALECVNVEPKNRPTAEDICTRLNQVIPSDNRVHTSHYK